MIKTHQDAEKFVQKHIKWGEKLWESKKEWDVAVMKEMFANDVALGWQGDYTNGIKETLAKWLPCQGAFKKNKTLAFEINTHSPSMIAFTEYTLWTDFKGREKFMIGDNIIEINKDGRIHRQIMTSKPKYANLFNETLMEYISQKQ